MDEHMKRRLDKQRQLFKQLGVQLDALSIHENSSIISSVAMIRMKSMHILTWSSRITNAFMPILPI